MRSGTAIAVKSPKMELSLVSALIQPAGKEVVLDNQYKKTQQVYYLGFVFA